jgi:predicted acyl esterase
MGHGSDTTYDEIVYHASSIDRWIEYWLYDILNGIMDSSKFTYASSTEPVNYNHWTFRRFGSEVWPPGGTANLRLYFCPDKKLSAESNLYNPDTVSFLNDVRNTAISLKELVQKGFTGTEFDSKFVKTYIYFESDVLNEDLTLVGTPTVNLVYSSSAEICQYNFQIWEVKPNGEMNFVTRINFTDRNYFPNVIKQKCFYGQAHSHIFSKGSRFRIYVTNLDNGPHDKFLGTNPFVLPVLKRARNYIFMSVNRASYIDLPVIGK